jgi:broad specificity phosphatase PhoE
MHLYLVRHGQTDDNFKSIVQGRIDNPLNDVGRSQARATGMKLRDLNIKFDHIYSSPLKRAKESASIINDILKVGEVIEYFDLIEREFGSLEGLDVSYMRSLVKDPNYKPVGFESDDVIINRVKNAVDEISKTGENILIVCHSHTIKALLSYIDNTKFNFDYPLLNAQVVKVEYKNNKYIVQDII